MRNVWTVARQSFVEKRVILGAAAAAALIPLVVPLLPVVDRSSAGVARSTTAVIVASSYAVISALIYGASCIAGGLRERRLSFYFSRPLSGFALWAGKMLGGVLLAGGALALALLPAVVTGASGLAQDWGGVRVLPAVPVVLILIMALAHAVAIVLSSRSRWIILDLAGLLVVGGAIVALLRLIGRVPAYGVVEWVSWTLAAVCAAALLAAGLVQVVVGRADARRGHQALSLTLWGSLASATARLGAYAAFLVHPTPRSLITVGVTAAPRTGTVIAVGGTARWRGGFEANFLLDTKTSRWLRISPLGQWQAGIEISANGALAAWIEEVSGGGDAMGQVVTCNLRSTPLAPRGIPIVLPARRSAIRALSHEGRFAAIQSEHNLAVHALPSGTLVASLRLSDSWLTSVEFLSDRVLRLEQWFDVPREKPWTVVVSSWDIDSGALAEISRYLRAPGAWRIRPPFPSDGEVAVQRDDNGVVAVTVEDERSRLVIAELWHGQVQQQPYSRWPQLDVAFMSDGGVALGYHDGAVARVRLFSPDWKPVRSIELPGWSDIALGAELAPGSLAVCVTAQAVDPRSLAGRRWECFVLDTTTGAMTSLGEVWPLAARNEISRWRGFAPGSTPARLFRVGAPGIAIWEPATGRLRPVLEPSQ